MSYRRDEFERMKERVFGRWADEITHPRLKAKIGFEDSLHELINRCMCCAAEEFDENVHRLLWSIPDSWRDSDFENDLSECTETVEVVTPTIFCGVPVDTNVIAAKREEQDESDWRMVFNAILNLCQRRNLLIPKDFTEVVPRNVPVKTDE